MQHGAPAFDMPHSCSYNHKSLSELGGEPTITQVHLQKTLATTILHNSTVSDSSHGQ